MMTGVKLLLFHSSHRLGGIQPSKVIQGTKLVEKQKLKLLSPA